MAGGSVAYVRDKIGGMLADRWPHFSDPRTDGRGTIWISLRRAPVGVVLREGQVVVHVLSADINALELPADDPDLLEEIDAALNEVGA